MAKDHFAPDDYGFALLARQPKDRSSRVELRLPHYPLSGSEHCVECGKIWEVPIVVPRWHEDCFGYRIIYIFSESVQLSFLRQLMAMGFYLQAGGEECLFTAIGYILSDIANLGPKTFASLSNIAFSEHKLYEKERLTMLAPHLKYMDAEMHLLEMLRSCQPSVSNFMREFPQ